MSEFPSLDRLAACLARLPGIGRRSAERMAIRLVRREDALLRDLTQALVEADKTINVCRECGSITVVNENPCRLCTATGRDDTLLCVVEEPSDIILMERSGGYHGRYHVLMGKLSPAKGDGPADLALEPLVKRLKAGRFEEVILALSTDMEGDATAAWLTECLKGLPVKVSRLASGLPAGSGLAYSDPVTLARAVRGRVVEQEGTSGGRRGQSGK